MKIKLLPYIYDMKRILLLFIVLGLGWSEGFSQAGMWTWMKGDSLPNSLGNHGVKGVPSPMNEPPSRYACGFWTDTAGNFWIYGGNWHASSVSSIRFWSDLWRFDPNTLEWTWMNGGKNYSGSNIYNLGQEDTATVKAPKGFYHPENHPGAIGYGMITWTTPDNHLWLFGGGRINLYDAGKYFWQYDPVINQWAWMGNPNLNYSYLYGTKGIGDSTTAPVSRDEGNSAWVDDSGDLWLFGSHIPGGAANDMWRYSVKDKIWTWMSGSNNRNDTGVYNIRGVPSVDVYPRARMTNFFWKDNSGNFWVGGGGGHPDYRPEMYQDIWKFNPVNLEWTWVKGNKGNDTGQVGSICQSRPDNKTGTRFENRTVWKINDDLILTFGGVHDFQFNRPYLNDIWGYIPSSNRWIKISEGQIPSYGIKGIGDIGNYPLQRIGSVGFIDRNKNLWMFGGQASGYYNDLWKYQVDTTCFQNCLAISVHLNELSTVCRGDSIEICAPSGYLSYLWNNGLNTPCFFASQEGEYYVVVSDSNECQTSSNSITFKHYTLPSVNIILKKDTLSSFGASTYQWYLNGSKIVGATSAVYIANEPGYYTLGITDANGCMAMSTPVLISGIDKMGEEALSFYPNPAKESITILTSEPTATIKITNLLGQILFSEKISGGKKEIDVSHLPSGMYFVNNLKFVKE